MALYELRVLNQKDYYKGFSYNSILYLNVISQMESCTTGKLAQALQISAPAATSKVNELIKQGAVIKTQSEDDKRVFYIKIHPDMEKTSQFITMFSAISSTSCVSPFRRSSFYRFQKSCAQFHNTTGRI